MMPHEQTAPIEREKKEDKIVGLDIRILDDGTFVLSMRNKDYSKNKEYSYSSIDELISDLKKDFGKKKEKNKEDYLSKK